MFTRHKSPLIIGQQSRLYIFKTENKVCQPCSQEECRCSVGVVGRTTLCKRPLRSPNPTAHLQEELMALIDNVYNKLIII